jgi:uncharacterized protein (UPF0264 family)
VRRVHDECAHRPARAARYAQGDRVSKVSPLRTPWISERAFVSITAADRRRDR